MPYAKAIVALLLAAPVFSQDADLSSKTVEPSRVRSFGRVRDRSGAVWRGATVHAIHRSHKMARVASDEQLTAKTDERGRFSMRLLVASAYDVWAVGEPNEDGAFRVSKIEHSWVGRATVVLTETQVHYARRVLPRMHESWNSQKPIRWRVFAGNSRQPRLAAWLQPDRDGALRLPAWPHSVLSLQAWVRHWPIFTVRLPTTEAMTLRYGAVIDHQKKKLSVDEARDALRKPYELRVPRKTVRVVTVRDQESGKPIAAATLLLEDQAIQTAPPQSADDGRISILATDSALKTNKWTVSSPTHREQVFELSAGESSISLQRGYSTKGRFAFEGRVDLALLIVLEATVARDKPGSWREIDARILQAAKDGRFRVPGRSMRVPFRLTAVLPKALRSRLSPRSGSPVAPLAVLRWPSRGAQAKDIGIVRADTLKPLSITVRQPDSAPPGCVQVLLTHTRSESLFAPDPLRVFTDRQGRVTVLCNSLEGLLVHAVTDRGAAWHVLEKKETSVVLTVDPRYLVRFRVTDRNGAPRAGQLVYLESASTQDKGPVSVLCRHGFLRSVARHFTRSDASGCGFVVAPALNVAISLGVYDSGRRIHGLQREWSGEDQDRIELVAPAKRP